MSVLGFATMNPSTLISLIDTSVWEIVLYANGSQKLTSEYADFVAKRKAMKKRERRKQKAAVQAVVGVDALKKCELEGVFWSTIVFDSYPNLMRLKERVKGMVILDVDDTIPGQFSPSPVNPKTLNKHLLKEGSISKLPVFASDTTYASQVEIEETTSRLTAEREGEDGEALPDVENGIRQLMSKLVDACGDKWVTGTDSFYMQYLFHCCTKGLLTSKITKHLPKEGEARRIWSRLLEIADSDVGYVMYSAFYSLCRDNDDPDYSVYTAISEFGLDAYAKDFLYAISVMPISGAYDFLVEIGDTSRERDDLPKMKLRKKPSKGGEDSVSRRGKRKKASRK